MNKKPPFLKFAKTLVLGVVLLLVSFVAGAQSVIVQNVTTGQPITNGINSLTNTGAPAHVSRIIATSPVLNTLIFYDSKWWSLADTNAVAYTNRGTAVLQTNEVVYTNLFGILSTNKWWGYSNTVSVVAAGTATQVPIIGAITIPAGEVIDLPVNWNISRGLFVTSSTNATIIITYER